MQRYILTGAPGAGKTAILRQLEADGFSVVEEAATDVIALSQAKGVPEPWKHPSFIDAIIDLQQQRQVQASDVQCEVQFHDRSPVCTAALAPFLGYPPSKRLMSELDRIKREQIYERRVFFIRNLGFIEPTAARRISFEDTLRFEKVHEDTYRQLGFELDYVEAGPLLERVERIKHRIKLPSKLESQSHQPHIRHLKITYWDLLQWLGDGLTEEEIMDDYPELQKSDFRAAYSDAARVCRGELG